MHVYGQQCSGSKIHQDSLDMNLSLQIDDLSIVIIKDIHQRNSEALHVSVLKHLEADYCEWA